MKNFLPLHPCRIRVRFHERIWTCYNIWQDSILHVNTKEHKQMQEFWNKWAGSFGEMWKQQQPTVRILPPSKQQQRKKMTRPADRTRERTIGRVSVTELGLKWRPGPWKQASDYNTVVEMMMMSLQKERLSEETSLERYSAIMD